MAQDKKKVIVYADWITKFEALTDEEAGKLIKHFFKYVNDLNPEYPDRITELSFIDIRATLKRDLEKWEKRAESSRENGKSGGRPKTNQDNKEPEETKQVLSEPTEPVNDTVNVKVNVSVTDNDIKKTIDTIVVPKVTTPKPKSSLPKEESSVYAKCVDYWLMEFHIGWTFKGMHGKAMKSIIQKLELILGKPVKEVSDDKIVELFKVMCQKLPPFFKDKDLQMLDSKFNEIIEQIKNKANGQSSKPNSIFA